MGFTYPEHTSNTHLGLHSISYCPSKCIKQTQQTSSPVQLGSSPSADTEIPDRRFIVVTPSSYVRAGRDHVYCYTAKFRQQLLLECTGKNFTEASVHFTNLLRHIPKYSPRSQEPATVNRDVKYGRTHRSKWHTVSDLPECPAACHHKTITTV